MAQKKLLAAAISMAVLTSSAFAASFQSFEQSAVTMGQANAGTAVTTDPSIQYYNPAGMAFIDQTELGLSAIVVNSDIHYNPIQATGFDGRPITGTNDNAGAESYVPGIYFIKPVNDKFAWGIGTEVPFGLETSYADDSIARYFAVQSQITSININPSLSYKFNPHISIGGGLIANYINAYLSQAIDAQGILHFPSFLPQPGDALLVNKASSVAMGWDVGIEVKPTNTTDLGLAYHSKINHSLRGSATVNSSNAFTLAQLFVFTGIQNANITAGLTLPAYTTFSASQELTSKWTVMGDAEYINWSSLKSVTLNYTGDLPNLLPMPSQTLNFDYHNTWRLALGQSYQIRPDLLLRMGVAYDETPIPNRYVRSAKLPDNDRYWASVGATYDINKSSDISFGYSHIFIRSSNSVNTLPNSGQTFIADYHGDANLVGLQYNLKFS